jgi:hypothetical protein
MPVYCYRRRDNGEIVELTMTVAQMEVAEGADHAVECEDGVIADRDITAEHIKTQEASCWPQYSDAIGVHPDQRQAAYEASVREGVPTRYDREGRAILTSRSHRRKLLKAKGLVDHDGGYGDG